METKEPKSMLSPLRLLVIIAIAIFTSESLVMVFIYYFQPFTSEVAKTLLDASLLIITLSPTFYYVLFRPLILHANELKQSERLLRESQILLHAIFDQAAVGIAHLDLKGQWLSVNQKLCDIVAYTREELLASTFQDITHPDDLELDLSYVRRMLAGEGSEFSMDKRYLRKSREIVWVNITVSLVRKADGAPDYFISVVKDITERKRAELALYESEARLSAIIETSMDAVVQIDAEGIITGWNSQTEEVFGWLRAEAIGRAIHETIIPPRHREAHVRGMKHFLLTGEGPILNRRVEIVGLHCDGREFPIELTVAPIKMGGKYEFSAFIRDISERKKDEGVIKDLLAEKELILKEVHHRIKNNMNSISSLLFLQAHRLANPEAVAALKDSQSRVQSMMVLYDKLYLSHSFMEISFKEYLSNLLSEIVANFANRDMVTVETHIEDFIINTKVLSTLGIIVNELITNAMKYAFSGRDKGLISVSASLKDKLVTLIIADNGVGIPEAIDIESSTGFGLELINMLTKQLRGSIRIERQDGRLNNLPSGQGADTKPSLADSSRFVLEFRLTGDSTR